MLPFDDKEMGAQASINYLPIHRFDAFQTYNVERASLTVTENVAMHIVPLPLFPLRSDDDVLFVAHSVQRVLVRE